MRLRFLMAFALASSTLAAHADTFTLVGTKGDTISFTLAHAPTPTYTSTSTTMGSRFDIDPVATVVNGLATSNSIAFYDLAAGGALTINDAGQGKLGDDGTGLLLEPIGQVLFTGSIYNPVFISGTYLLTDASALYGVNPKFKENFTLTITGAATPPATTVTPEPSSLVLLGTGLLSVTAFARRRFA